jgi:hypothetical protein
MGTTQQTIDNGVTGEQFLGMVRRWGKTSGIDLTKAHDSVLLEVYNYIAERVSTRVHTKAGYITLTMASAAESRKQAFQISNTGEIGTLSNKTTRGGITRSSVIRHGHQIPKNALDDVDLAEILPRLSDPKSWTAAASLGRDMLYLRLRKLGITPKDAKAYFNHAARKETPEVQGIKDSLLALMNRFEKRRRYAVLKNFLGHLDPVISEAMVFLGRQDSRIYNWLNAEENKLHQRNRLQIAHHHSALVPFAVGLGNESGIPNRRAQEFSNILTQSIDRGESLYPAIARIFDGGRQNPAGPFLKAATRFLLKLRPSDIPQEAGKNLYPIIQALSHVNPNWYPKTQADWYDLDICVTAFREFTNPSVHARPTSSHTVASCMQETGGDWSGYAALIKEHGRIEDISDWRKAIYLRTVVPALISARIANSVMDAERKIPTTIFYDGQKFWDILEASCKWHRQQGAFNTKIGSLVLDDEGPTISWPALSDPIKAPNGIVIQPLTTPADLREEGDAQKHCVAGYSSGCLYRTSHIISLREEETGNRLMTVELHELWKDAAAAEPALKIAQSQGFHRRPPKLEEKQATDWYLKNIKPDWEKIVSHRKTANENKARTDFAVNVGFDPYDAQARRKGFEICRPYFTTDSLRNMDYETWLKRTGIQAIINESEKVAPPVPLEMTPEGARALQAMDLANFRHQRRLGV